jgi:4'-phosphopantetheinyl transferase EntD
MKHLELPEPWRDRALVLGAAAHTEHSSSWFAADEVPDFARGKRREEWMHARIAAKQLAMQRSLCTDPRTCRVDRPRLVIAGAESEFISISHSHPYAAAAIDSAPVGIDVQVVRDLREAAAHLFLSEREEEQLRAASIDHRVIHFWCAKEAAWKQRHGAVTTLKQLPLSLVEERKHGLLFDTVETVRIGDVVVALTRPIS